MVKNWVDKVNGYGVLFRFILPAIIVIFGTILSGKLDDLKGKIDKLDTHFTNHLSEHKNIEILLEKRLTSLETILNKNK